MSGHGSFGITKFAAYSRAKGGLFAGASLASASIDSDKDANEALYGKPVDSSQIVREGDFTAPSYAKPLVELLDKISPKRLM